MHRISNCGLMSKGLALMIWKLFWFLALLSMLVFAACARSTASSFESASGEHKKQFSRIRSIDFSNFIYRGGDSGLQPTITLRHGVSKEISNQPQMRLVDVIYSDVTGDKSDDAIVILSTNTGGSALPHTVFIYSLKQKSLILLWTFETGDRASGGLRRVYGEKGELVVELYGKGKVIGTDLYGPDGMSGGDCCPTHFTRARYKWNGDRFVRRGKLEVLSNPEGHASVKIIQ